MAEDNNKNAKETDRGKEMRDMENKMGPQPVPEEQFGDEGSYMEPNAAQIPWKNVPYDPADSRPNPDSEMEGQAEEMTGKKPTKDRWGNPIEEVPAPRGEPQDVAAGVAYNPPTAEELAEQDKERRVAGAAHMGNQRQDQDRQRQDQERRRQEQERERNQRQPDRR